MLENSLSKLLKEKERNLSSLEEKLKQYLNNKEIRIRIDKQKLKPSLNISFKVSLENTEGNKINTKKKGDGTKRRITMALLEEKLKEQIKDEKIRIFILDEPDTHLHVRAQRELLELLREQSKQKQIVITTHSPFIINLLSPQHIRFITQKNNQSSIKQIKENNIEKLLYDLGVENISLFFTRKILITEGESEKNFIEHLYFNLKKMTTYGDFVKVIDGRSVTDAPRLAKVLLKDLQFPKNDIFILLDKDHTKHNDIQEIIEEFTKLDWKAENNLIVLGKFKEFEDIFPPEHIYEAWKRFVEKRGGQIGKEWTLEKIINLKEKCAKDGEKFSEKLRALNKGCKCKGIRFKKSTTFPQALAEFYGQNPDKLPSILQKLINKLNL